MTQVFEDIKIDAEFAALIPPLSAEERLEKGIVGWTRDVHKRCDYVLWLWKETGRYCLVPFPMLCGVFSEHWECWKLDYKVSRQLTRRSGSEYHSECVFVPRREVWAKIYETYGGSMKLQKVGV